MRTYCPHHRVTANLGTLVRTRAARTPLREGPGTMARQRLLLDAETLARRFGIAGGSHRVILPDGSSGYVAATAMIDAESPLRRWPPAAPLTLREKPQADAPVVENLETGVQASVLGRFDQFQFVRVESGAEGWSAPAPVATLDTNGRGRQ